MRLAKVVGNVVSTVKDYALSGYKLMIIEYIDDKKRVIAFDGAHAGVGDTVLVATDGGACGMILEDREVVADIIICGVVDHYDVKT